VSFVPSLLITLLTNTCENHATTILVVMPSLPNAEQTMTLCGVGMVRAENFSSITPRPPAALFSFAFAS
jgi:hypothetical protein